MDRTSEFRKIAASRLAALQQRVLGNSGPPRVPAKRSEFAVAASQVGAEIHATASKLAKLTKLVQSKSLFDDLTLEINQLTDIIKQELTALNAKLGQLQGLMAPARSGTKQSTMHSASYYRLLFRVDCGVQPPPHAFQLGGQHGGGLVGQGPGQD